MIIKQYDRVLMKDGSNASIVEIFEDKKSFIADIERNDDIDTEEIGIDDLQQIAWCFFTQIHWQEPVMARSGWWKTQNFERQARAKPQ